MKKVLLIILLLMPAFTCSAKDKVIPNPADYTITVHMQSLSLDKFVTSSDVTFQRLTVLVDGKKYELLDTHWRPDLLRVGDYKAKILKDETVRSYEYQRTYEFLMPDGETRQYAVVAEME